MVVHVLKENYDVLVDKMIYPIVLQTIGHLRTKVLEIIKEVNIKDNVIMLEVHFLVQEN